MNSEPYCHVEAGVTIWFVDGQIHKQDGPAMIFPDGDKVWFDHDKKHRIDGPAFIGNNGKHEWWINEVHITEEVNQWMRDRDVSWPWDEETQVEFLLTFL